MAGAALAAGGRLGACLERLGAATAHPERFLSIQDGLADDFISLTKTLYDFHKMLGADVISGSPLKELVIENFDEEQIWQQLELQNNAVLGYFKRAVARDVEGEEDLCLLPASDKDGSVSEDNEDQAGNEDQMEVEADFNNGHLEEESELEGKRNWLGAMEDDAFSGDDSNMDFDIDKLEQQTRTSKSTVKKTGEKSIVDDKFFKLAEMEACLDAVEKRQIGEKGDEEEEEEGINYFEDIFSEDDESEDEEEFGVSKTKIIKSARDLKYQDYFDPVGDYEDFASEHKDSDSDQIEGKEEEEEGDIDDEAEEMDEIKQKGGNEKSKDPSKRVTFSLPNDSDTEEEIDMFQAKRNSSAETKSSFEKRQEKMSEKIKSLEKELLMEKPWQLRGEVTGQKRPENSLLEEMVIFDHAVKMAPVITEETTLELEEIIKRRIKDQAWDDVVRKEKPKEDPYEYKKRLTLDHEKSKLSLAEIYEQEYLKLNQKKTEEEEKPEHAEIQKMMDSLFLRLDALSNFHFTPKPPVPEVKIVSNLPAITMEEVAPVSVSDAALLAPEEIKEKNKGGDVKTNAEKTPLTKKGNGGKRSLLNA
uniref:U3 small nucleolar ribonucleoprotein protein MPP10 n=1 Tax=Podarcis muralis TaxID=64176 RepID=A0A670K4S3_PODMU